MLIKFTDDTKRGGVANIGWPDFLSENLTTCHGRHTEEGF